MKFSTEFFKQAMQRWGQANPRFFAIIQKYSFLLAGFGGVLYYVTNQFLPGIDIEVPVWLTFATTEVGKAIEFVVMGLGMGGAGVSQVTIETPSTPAVE